MNSKKTEISAQGDRIWFHNNSNISQGNDNGIFSLKDGEMELHLGDLDEVVKSIQVIDENNILIWDQVLCLYLQWY